MSERVHVDVSTATNLIGLDSPRPEQVIYMLATALQVRHGVGDGHERGQFSSLHIHLPRWNRITV